jgi:threonine dehydrogenase-like Zn-dependent dehydrogenase
VRAAIIRNRGVSELVDVPAPEPAPGQLRIRLSGCGVCGSDLPVWSGRPWFDYPRPPGAPGHEGWGVVDALGAGVREPALGTPVAALSYAAYADYDIADARAVVPLPPQLSEAPFPGEALGCAVNVVRRSGIAAGARVAVVGIGFMGALVTQLAARAGARVIAVSRRPFALDVAREMGAAETILLGDAVHERVAQLTHGELCDVVVEAAGVQATLDAASPLVRVRGRLVIAGFHQDGMRSVDMQSWNWRGIDVINAHERDPTMYLEGMRLAAEAVANGRLDPAPLYTHAFPLERLGEALDMTRDRPDGFVKALVTMS